MLKRFFIVIAVILLLAQPLTAYADAVFDNEFSRQHSNKIRVFEHNRFCADGPDGYVTVREEPDFKNGEPISDINNGYEFTISYVYKNNGEYWGLISAGHAGDYGWIPMEQCLFVYTRYDFEKKHTSYAVAISKLKPKRDEWQA